MERRFRVEFYKRVLGISQAAEVTIRAADEEEAVAKARVRPEVVGFTLHRVVELVTCD